MTTWPEEGSSSDDEFEFYDPTAPSTGDGPVDARDSVDAMDSVDAVDSDGQDEPHAAAADDAQSDPAAGGAAADPRDTVQVTFDDDKRVIGVRVSNRWRERVRRDKKTLAEVVLQAVSANQALAGGPLWSAPAVEEASASPLNAAALDRLLERSVTLDEQAAELRASTEVRPTTFQGQSVQGTSANRKVTVTVDMHARTTGVDVDDEWVKQSTAEQTGAAILQAHQDAYARWVPPVVEPGEWDLLNSERTAIRDEIMAMFRNGI